MYTSLLVPTDGTDFSAKAVETAIELANALKAKVVLVTVTAPFTVVAVEGVMISQTPDDYIKWTKETAERRVAPLKAKVTAAGVACETIHIENFQAYDGILEAQKAKGCDLIVMASHGRRGISAMLLGSETQKVLTHSHVPVLVVRP